MTSRACGLALLCTAVAVAAVSVGAATIELVPEDEGPTAVNFHGPSAEDPVFSISRSDDHQSLEIRCDGETLVTVNKDGLSVSDANLKREVDEAIGQIQSLRERLEALENSTAVAESCAHLKEADPSIQSGLYEVGILPGGKRSVYCDMDADEGGWMLVWAGNGHENTVNVQSDLSPTPSRVGRLVLAQDLPVTRLRIDAGHASISGKVSLLTANSDYGDSFLSQFLKFMSPERDADSMSVANNPTFVTAENDNCGITSRVAHNVYTDHAHTWLIVHTGGHANGAIQVGSGYNKFCDANAGTSAYPTQYIRVWVK